MTVLEIDNDSLIQAAREALTRPDSFLYYGDLNMFVTWGYSISQTRDSSLLDLSNYRCLLADVTAHLEREGLDPGEYIEETRSSHWLCGWIEQLAVRVLVDESRGIVPDNITSAFRWLASAASYLHSDYPVWNDEDHSQLEFEAAHDAWDAYYSGDMRSWLENAVTFEPPRGARDHSGQPYVYASDYAHDMFNASADHIRALYYGYDGNEWYEESGSGMVNARHDEAMVYAARNAFGWNVR